MHGASNRTVIGERHDPAASVRTCSHTQNPCDQEIFRCPEAHSTFSAQIDIELRIMRCRAAHPAEKDGIEARPECGNVCEAPMARSASPPPAGRDSMVEAILSCCAARPGEAIPAGRGHLLWPLVGCARQALIFAARAHALMPGSSLLASIDDVRCCTRRCSSTAGP